MRAEPIAALFGQNRVKIAGSFPQLEEELCSCCGTGNSPKLLDTLVWALTDLMAGERYDGMIEYFLTEVLDSAPSPSVRLTKRGLPRSMQGEKKATLARILSIGMTRERCRVMAPPSSLSFFPTNVFLAFLRPAKNLGRRRRAEVKSDRHRDDLRKTLDKLLGHRPLMHFLRMT
jgi:hypothetical protein